MSLTLRERKYTYKFKVSWQIIKLSSSTLEATVRWSDLQLHDFHINMIYKKKNNKKLNFTDSEVIEN